MRVCGRRELVGQIARIGLNHALAGDGKQLQLQKRVLSKGDLADKQIVGHGS